MATFHAYYAEDPVFKTTFEDKVPSFLNILCIHTVMTAFRPPLTPASPATLWHTLCQLSPEWPPIMTEALLLVSGCLLMCVFP